MIRVCLDDGFSPANCPRFKLTFKEYVLGDAKTEKNQTINAQLFISKVKRDGTAQLVVQAIRGMQEVTAGINNHTLSLSIVT
jgi:hypothetical protein